MSPKKPLYPPKDPLPGKVPVPKGKVLPVPSVSLKESMARRLQK